MMGLSHHHKAIVEGLSREAAGVLVDYYRGAAGHTPGLDEAIEKSFLRSTLLVT